MTLAGSVSTMPDSHSSLSSIVIGLQFTSPASLTEAGRQISIWLFPITGLTLCWKCENRSRKVQHANGQMNIWLPPKVARFIRGKVKDGQPRTPVK